SSSPSRNGRLDSSNSPGGAGTRSAETFSAHVSPCPVRRNAKQPSGAPNHSTPSPVNAECSLRSCTALRYSDSVESASSSWLSTVNSDHAGGICSQSPGIGEKPNGGVPPSHG